MIRVKSPVGPDEVRFDAGHVLFVEGRGDDAIDPTVLRVLLGDQLRIEPLGASISVTSVAEALHQFHPNYYFLVDRDHHDYDFVEQCWSNFPEAGKRNLLVWRRREIENYFLDPDYLARSKFRVEDRDGNIVSGARERNEITRDLLQRDEAVQPRDFSELKRIIQRRIDAR